MDRVRWDTLALGAGDIEEAMEDLQLSTLPSDRLSSIWHRYLYFGARSKRAIMWPACVPPVPCGDTLLALSFASRRLVVDRPLSDPQRYRLEFWRRQVQYLATHVPQGHLAETFVLRPRPIPPPTCPPPASGVEHDPLIDRVRYSLGRKLVVHPPHTRNSCPWANSTRLCPLWDHASRTCGHFDSPLPPPTHPTINYALLSRHLRHANFFLHLCARWSYLPTHKPFIQRAPFHSLMASTTRLVRRADRPPTTDVGSPIPEANVRSRHPRTRFDSSTRLPSPKCPDSQVRALPHYRRLIQPAAPCFGVTVLSGKKTPPKCPPPRWLTADEHSELALSPFLTNLDPRHIPRVSTRLAKPPQVDFDVDFEPVSYQDTTPAYTATIAKRVAIICANVPPPADPYPLDEWALKRTPVYLRPTLPTVLQLAQERYLYLRSEHGGSITLPALIGLGATRVSREEQGAHTLDWRISASLQQLCDLTSLWPADPLCAPPHFETWLEHSSPPPCSRALIDLTNLTHDERRAFIARGPSPTHACVYVTFSNRSLKASLLRAGLVCVHTFPPGERVLYHPKWWHIFCFNWM